MNKFEKLICIIFGHRMFFDLDGCMENMTCSWWDAGILKQ